MHDVTQSTKDLFASGQQAMENLEELQYRAERTTDWRTQVVEHPLMAMGVAILGGLLLSRIFAGGRR